jgi:hypothetical protein
MDLLEVVGYVRAGLKLGAAHREAGGIVIQTWRLIGGTEAGVILGKSLNLSVHFAVFSSTNGENTSS